MGVREAYDARRASPQTPAGARPDTAGIRSRADETGEPGEEAHPGYQEECEEWPSRGVQDPGKRPGKVTEVRRCILVTRFVTRSLMDALLEQVYPEILSNEDATTGYLASHPGITQTLKPKAGRRAYMCVL